MIAITQHNWKRRVSNEETRRHLETDMWGRKFEAGHVVCHTEYVCEDCGAVKDEGDCTCEAERGERCPIRLDWLARQRPPVL